MARLAVTHRDWVLKSAPAAIGLWLYVVCVALHQMAPMPFGALMGLINPIPNDFLFTDLNAVLRAADCARQGVDVYMPSARMGGGVYNYAPMLLHVPGLNPAWRLPLGGLMGVLFMLTQMLLAPARGWGGVAWRVAALASGDVAYALDSGNLDVLMFLLVVVGLWLLRKPFGAFIGYGLFGLGGALKFYPAVLLALVLRDKRPRLLGGVAASVLAGLVYWLVYRAGVATAIAILPGGLPFRGVFGGLNVPFGLALLVFLPVHTLAPSGAAYFVALAQPYVLTYITVAHKVLVAAALVSAWQLRGRAGLGLAALAAAERLSLVAGAGLMGFCFLAAHMGFYAGVALWAVREYLWWWVIVRLLAFVLAEAWGWLALRRAGGEAW